MFEALHPALQFPGPFPRPPAFFGGGSCLGPGRERLNLDCRFRFCNSGSNGPGNGRRHELGELGCFDVVVAMGIGGFVVLVIEVQRISVNGSNTGLFDDVLCDIEVDHQHFLSLAPTTAIVAVAVAVVAPSTCPGSRQFHVSMRSTSRSVCEYINVSTIYIYIYIYFLIDDLD